MRVINNLDFPICYQDIYLRYLIEDDIEKYINWFNDEHEWAQWDAPWEDFPEDLTRLRDSLYKKLNKPKEGLPGSLQLCYKNGTYIGWVIRYSIDNDDEKIAIGIDIADSSFWGKGLGKQAFKLWIAIIFYMTDLDALYTETWSGNTRMVNLALSCRFEEIERTEKIREVRGGLYDAVRFKLNRETFLNNDLNMKKLLK